MPVNRHRSKWRKVSFSDAVAHTMPPTLCQTPRLTLFKTQPCAKQRAVSLNNLSVHDLTRTSAIVVCLIVLRYRMLLVASVFVDSRPNRDNFRATSSTRRLVPTMSLHP